MRKYFCVSDVHGFYDKMIEALDNNGFDKDNPDHIFVSCGDLLDRGNQPMQCLSFVNQLPADRKILILGNHETLMDDMLKRGEPEQHDYHNGTLLTVFDSYQLLKKVTLETTLGQTFKWFSKLKAWKTYRSSLIDFYETNKYVFVHGWIPCNRNDPVKYHTKGVKYTFNEDWKNGDWDSARWLNGMDAWHQGVRIPGKTIVCGHWHASFGNSKYHNDGVEFPDKYNTDLKQHYANFSPFIDDGIMAIDACTVLSHKVNCVVLEGE